MRTPDRARPSALVLLGAAAATAAVGVAALARTGAALCGHRVLVQHHDHAMAVAGGTAVPAAADGGICLILFYAAALAAAVCALAVLVLVGRPVARALAAAFRLLAPGAGARWAVADDPLLVAAGVRAARRRPSRAPPTLR
jgi:hypothetical protein